MCYSIIYYFCYAAVFLQFICLPSVYPSHHLIDPQNRRVSSPLKQFRFLILDSKCQA